MAFLVQFLDFSCESFEISHLKDERTTKNAFRLFFNRDHVYNIIHIKFITNDTPKRREQATQSPCGGKRQPYVTVCLRDLLSCTV